MKREKVKVTGNILGPCQARNKAKQICCSTKLLRQLSVFHQQTITKQTTLLVTQTTT